VGETRGVEVGVGVGVELAPGRLITASLAEARALVVVFSVTYTSVLVVKVRRQARFLGPVVMVARVPLPVAPPEAGGAI